MSHERQSALQHQALTLRQNFDGLSWHVEVERLGSAAVWSGHLHRPAANSDARWLQAAVAQGVRATNSLRSGTGCVPPHAPSLRQGRIAGTRTDSELPGRRQPHEWHFIRRVESARRSTRLTAAADLKTLPLWPLSVMIYGEVSEFTAKLEFVSSPNRCTISHRSGPLTDRSCVREARELGRAASAVGNAPEPCGSAPPLPGPDIRSKTTRPERRG